MYRVMLTQGGTFLEGTFESVRAAKRAGRATGNQFIVYNDAHKPVATWDPIHGWLFL